SSRRARAATRGATTAARRVPASAATATSGTTSTGTSARRGDICSGRRGRALRVRRLRGRRPDEDLAGRLERFLGAGEGEHVAELEQLAGTRDEHAVPGPQNGQHG